MAELLDRFLRRGGFALLVILVGGLGLVKSASFYGTLLHGFDSQFYYSAARSAVVSGDWDVSDDLPLSPSQSPFKTEAGYPRRPDGGIKNVFPVGLSLVEAALLYPAVKLSGESKPGDAAVGYTQFQIGWVAFGLLLIAALGLQITYLFARTLTSPISAAAVTFMAWLGTPLFYYTAGFTFSAHPTTFCLMALMMVVADRLNRTQRTNAYIFVFGVLAAFLYLVRPHQAIYTVLVAAWRILPLLRTPTKRWLPGVIAGLVVCTAAVAFQAGIHHLNVGSYSLIAHGSHDHPMITGHFEASPHFDIVLFSPVRGLFWVTPIIPLSLLGFAWRWRAIPWWGWVCLINAAIKTTILAFWSDPGQGDSFGIRMWAVYVPAVVCGLAVLVGTPTNSHRWLRWGTFTASAAGVAWTLLICWTYMSGRLPDHLSYSQVVAQVLAPLQGGR